MTSAHELARILLEGPDWPVIVSVSCSEDSVSSTEWDEDDEDADNATPVGLEIRHERDDEMIRIDGYVLNTRFGYVE